MKDADFAALIATEARAIADFIDLLEEEHRLLTENAREKLEALTQRKLESLKVLESVARRRDEWLGRNGLGGEPGDVRSILARLETSDSSGTDAWRRLMALAAKAKAINQRNGALIQSRMHLSAQYLEILRNAGNRLAVYGPDGKTQVSSSARPIATG
jgi:flagellar biosynthesis/type III secretory pathway chaperone